MDNNFTFSAKRLDNGDEVRSMTIVRGKRILHDKTEGEYEIFMTNFGDKVSLIFDDDGNVVAIYGKFYRVDPDSIEPVMQED